MTNEEQNRRFDIYEQIEWSINKEESVHVYTSNGKRLTGAVLELDAKNGFFTMITNHDNSITAINMANVLSQGS